MRTATLTFHAPNNNGSFLQAYALQKVLQDHRIENEIVNFYSDKQERQYKVLRVPKSMGDVARNGISVLHYKALSERFRRFNEMRAKYLTMTQRIKTKSEVTDVLQKYDVIICGSDQIWNTEARDFSDVYLLRNFQTKKIAYAVSCGSNIERIDATRIVDAARKFDAVSVRESTTFSLLQENGIANVEIVLDPTLLLEKSSYQILFENTPIIDGDYIFLYTINYSDSILKAVQEFSETHGIPVYTPFTGFSAYKCSKYGIKVLWNVAPDQFLNLMNYARWVFSNSFHGIAFSIIMNKNFYRVCELNAAGRRLPDDRIDSLLSMLNLEDRNITDIKIRKNDIDYSKVNQKLAYYCEKSIKWLCESL